MLGAIVLLGALRERVGMTWRLAALIALPLLFWALTGLARADLNEPAASRYLYPGALFLLLIAIEAGAGMRLSRRGLAVLAPLLLGALIANVGAMRDGAGFLRDRAAEVDGGLAAMRLAPPGLSPTFQPEPQTAPQIRADYYLAAVKDLGSPAPSPAQLPSSSNRARCTPTRRWRAPTAFSSPRPAQPGGPRPGSSSPTGPAAAARGACVASDGPGPRRGRGARAVARPAGSTVVPTTGTPVTLRRFADGFGEKLGCASAAGPRRRSPIRRSRRPGQPCRAANGGRRGADASGGSTTAVGRARSPRGRRLPRAGDARDEDPLRDAAPTPAPGAPGTSPGNRPAAR